MFLKKGTFSGKHNYLFRQHVWVGFVHTWQLLTIEYLRIWRFGNHPSMIQIVAFGSRLIHGFGVILVSITNYFSFIYKAVQLCNIFVDL